MRYGHWRVFENSEAEVRQLAGPGMEIRGNEACFLLWSRVHMWKWRKAYDFLRLRTHSIYRKENYDIIVHLLNKQQSEHDF